MEKSDVGKKFTKYFKITSTNQGLLLSNFLNNAVILIDERIAKAIESESFHLLSVDEIFGLEENSFILTDEEEKQFLSTIKNAYESVLRIVFLATMECNFACDYCYESRSHEEIGDETYEMAKDLIANSPLKNVYIEWFGGEPTLKIKEILEFSEKIKDCGKNVNFAMTTNGYLLDEKIFQKFLSAGVNSFQITLDGTKESHDKHRVLRSGTGTFDKILGNLKGCSKTNGDFSIVVRCNFTTETNLIAFVDEMSNCFKGDSRFSFLFYPVGTWNESGLFGEKNANGRNLNYVNQYAVSKGLRLSEFEKTDVLISNVCYANQKNSFVIGENGKILKCTVKLKEEKNQVGFLRDKGKLRFNDNVNLWASEKIECVSCNVFPKCFGYFCPHRDLSHCRESLNARLDNYYKFRMNVLGGLE